MSESHDARSIEIYESIAKLDFENGDELELQSGGEGDNGERLLDLLDMHFQALDGPIVADEICDNFIAFRYVNGEVVPGIYREAERFMQVSGRTQTSVEGNEDDEYIRFFFTPEMTMEEAEALEPQFGIR